MRLVGWLASLFQGVNDALVRVLGGVPAAEFYEAQEREREAVSAARAGARRVASLERRLELADGTLAVVEEHSRLERVRARKAEMLIEWSQMGAAARLARVSRQADVLLAERG